MSKVLNMEFDALDTIFKEEIARVSKEEVQVEDTYEDINKWHDRVIRDYEYLFIIGMECNYAVRNDLNMRNRRGSMWKGDIFEITRYMEMLKCFGKISDIRFSIAECDHHNKGRFEYDNLSSNLMDNTYNSLYINIGFTPRTTIQKWLCYFSYLTDLANRRKINTRTDIFKKDVDGTYKNDERCFSEIIWQDIVKDRTYSQIQRMCMNIFLVKKIHMTEEQATSIADTLVQKLKNYGHT